MSVEDLLEQMICERIEMLLKVRPKESAQGNLEKQELKSLKILL